MAFRTRTRFKRARAKQDLVWVPFLVRALVDETGAYSVICDPTVWNATAGTGRDSATLLRITGTLSVVHIAAATSADIPFLGWGIVKQDVGISGGPDPISTTDLATRDWLQLGYTVRSGTANTADVQRWDINIPSKRRLGSDEEIGVTYRMGSDTASPTSNLVFAGRCLVSR